MKMFSEIQTYLQRLSERHLDVWSINISPSYVSVRRNESPVAGFHTLDQTMEWLEKKVNLI